MCQYLTILLVIFSTTCFSKPYDMGEQYVLIVDGHTYIAILYQHSLDCAQCKAENLNENEDERNE
jgi:hypothetical protein